MKRILLCQECKRQWDVTPYEVGQKLRCLCGFLMEVPLVRPHAPNVQHCAACGAPRDPARLACRYCGAVPDLTDAHTSLVCPHCYCRTADDSQFCQACGKTIQAAPLDHLTGKLNCPRCQETQLVNRKVGEFAVDECPGCGGTWIMAAVFARVVNQQARDREEKEYAHQVRTFSPLEDGGPVRYVPCPVCQRRMNRKNFARVSGVIVDECRNDGVWLDRDELHKIAEYVASGGMRRTKQVELRDLEDQKRRLSSLPTGATMPTGGGEGSGEPFFGNWGANPNLLNAITFLADWFKR